MTEERGKNGGEDMGALKEAVKTAKEGIDALWSALHDDRKEFHAGLDAIEKRRSDGDEKLSQKIDDVKDELWKQRNEMTRIIATLVVLGNLLAIAASAAIKLWL